MNYTEKFIENTREYISACSLLVGEIEKSCGVSRGYLVRSAKSNTSIPLETACKLAHELGVTVDDLITGKCMRNILAEEKERLEKRLSEIDSLISGDSERKNG